MNWEQQTSLSQFAENRSDFAEDLEDDAAIAETHEYDENLENHAAIQMKSVCHAVTSGVDEIRQRQYDATACGIEPIDSLKIRPGKNLLLIISRCVSRAGRSTSLLMRHYRPSTEDYMIESESSQNTKLDLNLD